MDLAQPDPGSFRDPDSRVFAVGDRVLRAFSADGARAFEALAASPFFSDAITDGRIVASERLDVDPTSLGIPANCALLVEHRRLPVWSYPYEWSFSMLRDAAILQLELLLGAMADGLTCKDATPYNIQFDGVRPTFVDVGSFERLRPGEPWYGYLQFCQLFLYPLLVEAYARLPFQPWLRAQVDGITPTQASRLLGPARLAKKGVAVHVALHARAQRRFADTDADIKGALRSGGFSTAIIEANIKGLLKIVDGVRTRDGESAWSEYGPRSHYSDRDLGEKEAFVREVAALRSRGLVWDVGCNDGRFARLVASGSDRVLAFDNDATVVDHLYRDLRAEGAGNIVPLVVDFADPSPGIGWRGRERAPFLQRNQPDLVLALAVVHHLAITNNVPPSELLDALHDLDCECIVEFPTEDDPLVRKLVRNKRAGVHVGYTLERFEREVEERFTVARRVALGSGTRVLYHLAPR